MPISIVQTIRSVQSRLRKLPPCAYTQLGARRCREALSKAGRDKDECRRLLDEARRNLELAEAWTEREKFRCEEARR